MREILFRGKRLDNGEWYYGSYLFLNVSNVDWTGAKRGNPEDVHYVINEHDINYAVDPKTVGQYTGMKDKNGKRIFEGDIVRVEYTGSKVGDSGTGTVVFDGFMFAIPWGWHKDLVCLTGFCNHTFEVIGNIHDNQELIAEEQP